MTQKVLYHGCLEGHERVRGDPHGEFFYLTKIHWIIFVGSLTWGDLCFAL